MSTSGRSQATRSRSLVDDRRGAVMVVAVFMAAFLVGALWYVIGIGHAALYHERMQDGADAVAYAAAVYHARGMNLIAMINIIMAALLAILIALKLVQAINFLANVISCAISAACLGVCVIADFVCGVTTDFEPTIADIIKGYETFLKPTMKGLHIAQVGVAKTMPWVAEGKVVADVAPYYKEPVTHGGMLSVSLVPHGERLGLPVQEGDGSVLCGKAGEIVGHVISLPFSFLGIGGFVSGVMGGLAKSFPALFCNSKGSLGGHLDHAAKNQICQGKKKGFDKKHKHDHHPPKFDMKKCMNGGWKSAEKDLQGKMGGLGKLSGQNNYVAMEVYDSAQNGNGYFQVWSLVTGDDKFVSAPDRGVEVSTWGSSKAPGVDIWGKFSFAQAEFYYDWRKGNKDEGTSGEWDDYKENTMWNMRWRARFRRVHPFTGTLATGLGGKLGGIITSKLGNVVGGALAEKSFLKFAMGDAAASIIGDKITDALKKAGGKVDSQIQHAGTQTFYTYKVVH